MPFLLAKVKRIIRSVTEAVVIKSSQAITILMMEAQTVSETLATARFSYG
jgi:hypothetical protein